MMTMTRSALSAIVCVAALGSATVAQAQSAPPADGRYSAQFDVAATLGHKSDASIGGELGYRYTDRWDFYFEFGHMGNVATSDLDRRAQLIANTIGASESSVQKANYYDVGARYKFRPHGPWHPYAVAGLGAATVRTKASFFVNGQDVTGQLANFTPQILLGSDLSGSLTKALFVLGAGVTRPYKNRYFFDGSYRFGHIFPKTSAIDNDVSINTQRVQIGVGVRF
jgi:opacity protein-like surface antigen